MSQDEAPPPPPSSPPDLKVVRNKAKRNGVITQEIYEHMAQAYLTAQTRSMRQLQRDTGLSLDTCRRAITLGWPSRGWASLRERALLFDKRAHEQSDRAPLTPEQVMDARRFLSMRNENINLGRTMRALAMRLANKVNDVINVATAHRHGKRTRVVDVQMGKRIVQKVIQEDVTLPPYLPDLTRAVHELGVLAFAAGKSEREWARIAPPDDADGNPAESTPWESMTDEQLAHIASSGGKLPPGLSHEVLLKI